MNPPRILSFKPKTQLYLLPFAGGNMYSFNTIIPSLVDFDVITLELPGRGKRIREPLIVSFEQAVDDYFIQIVSRLSSAPFMIYGHSMGAYLAFFVCQRLERIGKLPVCLFVSGNAGMGTYGNIKRHLMTDDNFIESVKVLGGLSDELTANNEALEFFKPVLRADFRIIEQREYTDVAPIIAPIYAIMGDQEEKASLIGNWAKFTNGKFSSVILKGNHFFIYNNASELAAIFKSVLQLFVL